MSSYPHVPLGEACTIVGGGTPRRSNPAYFGGTIPWVTPTDVTSLEGMFVARTKETITDAGLRESSARMVPAGTVLMTSRATIGYTAVTAVPVATNQGFANLTCGDKLLPEYVAFWLRHRRDHLIQLAGGTTFKELPKSTLKKVRIPLPPLQEQRRVVTILNRVAKVEQLRQRAAERLRELESALFVRTFGTAKQIASKFRCRPLREVTEIASGATKGRKIAPEERIEVPYLRVANVQDGFLDLAEMKTIAIRRHEEAKYALAAGDLVMTEGGDIDKLGRAAIWRGELDYCAHQNHIYRVRPNRDFVLTDYLRDLAGSEYGKAYFRSVAKRTTGIASMNKTQLGGLPVPLPPLELQERYESLARTMQRLSRRTERAVASTSGLSTSVLTRLVPSS